MIVFLQEHLEGQPRITDLKVWTTLQYSDEGWMSVKRTPSALSVAIEAAAAFNCFDFEDKQQFHFSKAIFAPPRSHSRHTSACLSLLYRLPVTFPNMHASGGNH